MLKACEEQSYTTQEYHTLYKATNYKEYTAKPLSGYTGKPPPIVSQFC